MRIIKTRWIAVSSILAVLATCSQVLAQADAKLIPFWDDRESASQLSLDHSPWQSILDAYLDDQHPSGVNRFNYAAVSDGDTARLGQYLEYLQALEPRQLNELEQKAYWINLYNATTVFMIVNEDANTQSIRGLRSGVFTPGPWRRKAITVVQQPLSLEDIQHGILRPIWQDARIHYVLHYASIGSPNLQKLAFTANNIEALLNSSAREFIAHPRAVSISAGKALALSRIYQWYRRDFGANFSQVIDHIQAYAEPDLAERLNGILRAEYQYDWSLNSPQ